MPLLVNTPLIDCRFSWNEAFYGGGIYNVASNPNLTNCIIEDGYGGDGVGMYNSDSCPTLTDCSFDFNMGSTGVGMFNTESCPTLTDCSFYDNFGCEGVGMFNTESCPTLIDCSFEGNYAWDGNKGGGMANEFSTPLLINCVFRNNEVGIVGPGGGMDNYYSDSILIDCTFERNRVVHHGGGMCNYLSRPSLVGCRFAHNKAGCGGGIANFGSSPTLRDSIFSGNRAYEGGGAVFSTDSNNVSLGNCTFRGNTAANGSAVACYPDEYAFFLPPISGPSNVRLENCILWDGGDEVWNNDESTITVTHSDLQGGYPGEGNIDADPCFAVIGYWDDNGTPTRPWDDVWFDGDYHLKSQAGRWDPNSQSWVIDDVTSPCIDAGDPMAPIGQEPFPNGGIVNMGAYGGTEEASKSYFGQPPCETIVAGDINGDCIVNFLDFRFVALRWLRNSTP